MLEKDIRDYIDIGKIVSDYEKFPEKILEIAEGEMKRWSLQIIHGFVDDF